MFLKNTPLHGFLSKHQMCDISQNNSEEYKIFFITQWLLFSLKKSVLLNYSIFTLPNFLCTEDLHCPQSMDKEIDAPRVSKDPAGSFCLWLALSFRRKIPCISSISFSILHLMFSDIWAIAQLELLLCARHFLWTKCYVSHIVTVFQIHIDVRINEM